MGGVEAYLWGGEIRGWRVERGVVPDDSVQGGVESSSDLHNRSLDFALRADLHLLTLM